MQVCAYFQSHSGRLCAVKYNGDELKGLEEFYIMPRTELYGGNDIKFAGCHPCPGICTRPGQGKRNRSSLCDQ